MLYTQNRDYIGWNINIYDLIKLGLDYSLNILKKL